MQTSSRWLRSFCIAAATLFITATALAKEANPYEIVTLRGDIKENTYLAGGSVYALANIAGDLVVAGGQVEIENDIRDDILAAGGKVEIRAHVGDDLRAAGGEVTLASAVSGDAVMAGGQVTLAPVASVGGRAWLAGGTVIVNGSVDKELRVMGGHIIITGHIGGDVELCGDKIEIRDGATIAGNLLYRSTNEAKIDEGARITGTVARGSMSRRAHESGFGAKLGFSASLAVAAIVFYLLFPLASLAGARTITSSPWQSLGLGLAFLIVVPIATMLLFITVIGIWLALVALALYLVALLVGYLTGAIWLGDLGLGWADKGKTPTTGWRVLSIALALLALSVICLIPTVGGLAIFGVMLLGLGGLMPVLLLRHKKAK